jgi:phospholipid N-methyltransferase
VNIHARAVITTAAAGLACQQVYRARPVRAAVQRGRADRDERRTYRRAFRRDWHTTGPVWPTSALTALRMLALAGDPWMSPVIVEAGAGTGVLTRRILAQASPLAEVHVFERDPGLRALLQARFGHDQRFVLHPDAGQLTAVLGGRRAGLIVSALPWTSMGAARRDELLGMFARSLDGDAGVMVAIWYSAGQEPVFSRFFAEVRAVRSWRNLPPAVLYQLTGPKTSGG